MTINIYINSLNVWLQGEDDTTQLKLWAEDKLTLPEDFILPKPSYYPKGQLRRLSPFSKVILHSLDIPQALNQNLPLVFASQHGDLAKTVNLIKDAALGEDLSPTQFALSVHNATTGLFSIATNNTAATTTISAGENTFIEGLIEAAMQSQQENTPVIYTYCDFDVPEEYHQYQDRKLARCISLIITSEVVSNRQAANEASVPEVNQCNKMIAKVALSLNSQSAVNQNSKSSDLSLDFIRHIYLECDEVMLSDAYNLSLVFN